MTIKRVWAMPSRWTFTIKPIRELLEREVGFSMDQILLVPHGGNKNDTIVTVEVKI